MKLKKIVCGIGLTVAAVATIGMTATSASAASNIFIRTYQAPTMPGAYWSCVADANRANAPLSGSGEYYYCTPNSDNTTNMWRRVNF